MRFHFGVLIWKFMVRDCVALHEPPFVVRGFQILHLTVES